MNMIFCYNVSGDNMLEKALTLLSLIEQNGYRSYLVGGFVRDYLMGNESNDIDIATNATPRQLKEMFPEANLSYEEYGSVTLLYKAVRFEITTFRKEIQYANNRKPMEIEYIDNLYEDLLRRDFTVNTICMDKNGKIIDLLDGQKDIEDKMIRVVGDSNYKLSEDALRILRAVRFATTLGFTISDRAKEAINNNKDNLKLLSFDRKKQELDKIFSSLNVKEGINLLCELGLDKALDLNKLSEVVVTDDILGIWAFLDVTDLYSFNGNEKDLIIQINEAKNLDNLNNEVLYLYGLYINTVAGSYKGINKKDIIEKYNMLPIKSRKDLDITVDDITDVFNMGPGSYLKNVFKELEKAVLCGKIGNNNYDLLKYCDLLKKEKVSNLEIS